MINFSGELTFGHCVLSFIVPKGTSVVALSGTTVKKGFIYGYLYDKNQRLRANLLFEKADTKVILSDKSATLGGISGEIYSGEWQLHLYNLEGENRSPKAMFYSVAISFNEQPEILPLDTCTSLTDTNEITFDYNKLLNPDSGWYRGDLHAHTQLSDGNNTLEAAVDIVRQQQLDFFFLTEHNVCHPQLPVSDRTLILPSIEITTDQGHFNVHGPRRGLNMFNADYSSAALIEQGLGLAEAGESFISINHPVMKPWHWRYSEMLLHRVNAIEICCDPTWPTSPVATERALMMLSALWNAGHRIVAISGSDAHLEPHERNANATEPEIYGDPSTFVFADGLSGDKILAGLRLGHVYSERQCGLSLSINQGNALPGQNVRDSIVDYYLAVTDRSIPYYAECIADGKVLERHALSPDGVSFQVDMSKHAWVRIDICRGQCNKGEITQRGDFEGVINAIYNGHHASFSQPLVETWGELMALMVD